MLESQLFTMRIYCKQTVSTIYKPANEASYSS